VESRLSAGYHPRAIYESNPFLREVIVALGSGQFSHGDGSLFRPLLEQLLNQDPYLLLADYQWYVDCQDHVSETYRDQDKWSRMSIPNAARMGKLSSDRAVREYCLNIWRIKGIG
jgi:starch phosphorylase